MKSLDQARKDLYDELARKGMTLAAWARLKGVPPHAVYDVLRGRSLGRFGASHNVAIALELKEGEPANVPDKTTASNQDRKAA